MLLEIYSVNVIKFKQYISCQAKLLNFYKVLELPFFSVFNLEQYNREKLYSMLQNSTSLSRTRFNKLRTLGGDFGNKSKKIRKSSKYWYVEPMFLNAFEHQVFKTLPNFHFRISISFPSLDIFILNQQVVIYFSWSKIFIKFPGTIFIFQNFV